MKNNYMLAKITSFAFMLLILLSFMPFTSLKAEAMKRDITYQVQFDLNGGTSNKPNSQIIQQGEKVAEPPFDLFDGDKLFDGWYKEKSCKEKWDFENDVVTKNITLYAKWIAITKFCDDSITCGSGNTFGTSDTFSAKDKNANIYFCYNKTNAEQGIYFNSLTVEKGKSYTIQTLCGVKTWKIEKSNCEDTVYKIFVYPEENETMIHDPSNGICNKCGYAGNFYYCNAAENSVVTSDVDYNPTSSKGYTFEGWSEYQDAWDNTNNKSADYVPKSGDSYQACDFDNSKTYYAVWKNGDKIVVTNNVVIDGTCSIDRMDKYGFSYDATTYTLTLNNATFDLSKTFGSFYDSEEHTAIKYTAGNQIIIELKGNNQIGDKTLDSNTAKESDYAVGYGIYSNDAITVKGSGNLSINDGRCGIFCAGTLEFKEFTGGLRVDDLGKVVSNCALCSKTIINIYSGNFDLYSRYTEAIDAETTNIYGGDLILRGGEFAVKGDLYIYCDDADIKKASDVQATSPTSVVAGADNKLELSEDDKYVKIGHSTKGNTFKVTVNSRYDDYLDLKLVKGNKTVNSKDGIMMISGGSPYAGSWNFTDVAPGTYNIVATQKISALNNKEIVLTKAVVINGSSDSIIMTMPSADTNSVLEVADDGTPDIVVDGLSDEADIVAAEPENSGKAVEVKMTADNLSEEKADGSADIKAIADPTEVLEYFDFDILKTIWELTGGVRNDSPESQSNIHNTSTLMTLFIPYNTNGKSADAIKVYRYHNDGTNPASTDIFTRYDSVPTNPVDGSYYVDMENGIIYIYAQKFSTYAIGYKPDDPVVTVQKTNDHDDSINKNNNNNNNSNNDNKTEEKPEIEATSLKIKEPAKKILTMQGETLQLEAVITPSNVTSTLLMWKSSNEQVISVDANGKITALAEGKAIITVSTYNGKYDCIEITVSFGAADSQTDTDLTNTDITNLNTNTNDTNASTNVSPKTGDSNNSVFWFILMLAGVSITTFGIFYKKKKH